MVWKPCKIDECVLDDDCICTVCGIEQHTWDGIGRGVVIKRSELERDQNSRRSLLDEPMRDISRYGCDWLEWNPKRYGR